MCNKIEGLIAAPFTGFNSDMTVNVGVIDKYANGLKNAGVGGVFVNGSTGEGLSLTVSQRKQITEVWTEHCDENFKLIVHVGAVSLLDCMYLAAHAQKNSAYAIGMMGPCFYKPAGIDELVEFSAKVASAASSIPFYYYHIPSMTGVDFLMGDYVRKASEVISNFAGIKYTHHDIMDYMDCNGQDGKFDMLYGRDETLLAGLAVGAKGAVGSTYNYMPELYLQMIEAFNAGDMEKARNLQLKSIEIVKILIKDGNAMGTGKAIMKICGLDLGGTVLPNKQLCDSELKELENALETVDFFHYSIKL